MIDLSHIPSKRQAEQENRFTLWGHTFSVDPDMIPYNSIRKQFRGLAHEAEADFESRVVNRCKSLDDLIKYGSDIFGECMQPLWNACVQALISVGIVHIDVSEFIARYQDYYDYWNEAFDVVADQYAAIVCNQAQLNAYRKQRRENRSRLEGGGFGLAGAAKGIAVAETVNLAFGAAHMVFNGLGKLGSSIAASNKKNQIFHNPQTHSNLAYAVYRSAFFTHTALIACMNEELGTSYFTGASSALQATSDGILHNIQQYMANKDAAWQLLLKGLSMNPYHIGFYQYIIDYYADPKGELEQFADYWGINISHLKELAIDECCKKFDVSTVETARASLKQMQIYMDKYHFYGDFPTKTRAKKVLKAYHDSLCSVRFDLAKAKPYICETQEQAKHMQAQVDYIESMIKSHTLRDEPDCIAARQQLENLEQINGEPVMEEAKRPYTMALNQICEDYDLKARTLFGKVYPNRETVQDVLEIYNDMKRRLDNNPSPQQCANIRYRLEALDLAEEEKVKVRKLIFECENKKELKKIRSINFVAILLLIGMIAIGACLPITATPELHDMHVLYHGQELLLHDHNVVSGALGIVEGLKNGAAVFGKSVLTLFLNALADYLDGFHGTLDGHIFWMLFGWIKALWDNIWLTFCRYGASLWYTFRQSNGIGYCAGYITSTVISWVICSHLSKTEEEHVAAMKKK